jgi:hypothetical protein
MKIIKWISKKINSKFHPLRISNIINTPPQIISLDNNEIHYLDNMYNGEYDTYQIAGVFPIKTNINNNNNRTILNDISINNEITNEITNETMLINNEILNNETTSLNNEFIDYQIYGKININIFSNFEFIKSNKYIFLDGYVSSSIIIIENSDIIYIYGIDGNMYLKETFSNFNIIDKRFIIIECLYTYFYH